MGNGLIQEPLFTMPLDERHLDDPARTVLEAIDKLGPITARQAGTIVYRFRGFVLLTAVRRAWLNDAGRRVLGRLQAGGLVRPLPHGRWERA